MDFEDEHPLVLQPQRAPQDGGVHHDQIVGRSTLDYRRDLPTADGKQDDLIGLFGGSPLLVWVGFAHKGLLDVQSFHGLQSSKQGWWIPASERHSGIGRSPDYAQPSGFRLSPE